MVNHPGEIFFRDVDTLLDELAQIGDTALERRVPGQPGDDQGLQAQLAAGGDIFVGQVVRRLRMQVGKVEREALRLVHQAVQAAGFPGQVQRRHAVALQHSEYRADPFRVLDGQVAAAGADEDRRVEPEGLRDAGGRPEHLLEDRLDLVAAMRATHHTPEERGIPDDTHQHGLVAVARRSNELHVPVVFDPARHEAMRRQLLAHQRRGELSDLGLVRPRRRVELRRQLGPLRLHIRRQHAAARKEDHAQRLGEDDQAQRCGLVDDGLHRLDQAVGWQAHVPDSVRQPLGPLVQSLHPSTIPGWLRLQRLGHRQELRVGPRPLGLQPLQSPAGLIEAGGQQQRAVPETEVVVHASGARPGGSILNQPPKERPVGPNRRKRPSI